MTARPCIDLNPLSEVVPSSAEVRMWLAAHATEGDLLQKLLNLAKLREQEAARIAKLFSGEGAANGA